MFHTEVKIVTCLLVTILGASCLEELPDFIHVCNRNDPELENCVSKAVEAVRPVLAKGDPKYGIPLMEPLDLGDLIVSDKVNGQGLKVSAKEITTLGASNFNVRNMKIDLDKQSFDFEIFLPELLTQGKYNLDGQILLLPIKGSGGYKGNFSSCIGSVTLRGSLVEKEGVTYMKFHQLDIKIKVGKGKMHFDNLFGGDKVLGEVINTAINNNFDMFSRDIIPLIEKSLSSLFLKIGSQIVDRFTYDQLFPK